MNLLTFDEKRVIEMKGTERPFSGEYVDFFKPGIFICRKCNNPLFSAKDKFDAGCGWPAFDDEVTGGIQRQIDVDRDVTEIVCANCGGHLGHEFVGERLTDKNIRHCVNSLSIKFVAKDQSMPEVYHE